MELRGWFTRESVQFREIEHEPTHTSEESARARGEELKVGGKAILMKTDDVFRLFVLSAVRKLDSTAIKKHLQVKKLRFASRDELFSMTTLFPGAVPPFSSPILPFELYLDPSVLANDRIAFNAGTWTNSIVMPIEDYLRLAKPHGIFCFTVDEGKSATIQQEV
ncbi:MAG TPA: YbaK/EbsC family protein [Blastocatellia bacterium]|nr:YbaK/EbsC family protein [Blastocatellia bacterium]